MSSPLVALPSFDAPSGSPAALAAPRAARPNADILPVLKRLRAERLRAERRDGAGDGARLFARQSAWLAARPVPLASSLAASALPPGAPRSSPSVSLLAESSGQG
eukprot:1111896-Pyramimonas_sp.AAC.1